MLLAVIPAADDQHAAWCDCIFEGTLEIADGHQMAPVLRCSDGDDADTHGLVRENISKEEPEV